MHARTSMEKTPELISNKRKRSSSAYDPFLGIFTRSKAHIYLHCNRSGLARSDSFRRSKHRANLQSSTVRFLSKIQFQSHSKKPRRKSERKLLQSSADADDLPGMMVKDLRTRRIFSLASMANNCGLCFDDEEEEGSEKRSGGLEKEGFSSASKNLEGMKCDSSIDKEDVGWNYFDKVKQGEDKDIVKSSVGSTNKEHTSANSIVSQGNVKSSEDVEISNEVGEMDEECMQATPPDAEILYRDKVSWNLSTDNLQNREGFQNSMDKRNGNNSRPISVLNPWSRVKVFRAPGSFSYRRLLPYLMDMVQDNSCALRNGKSMDELKTDSPSMKIQAGDPLSRSVPIFADGLSNGTDSNLISIEKLPNSSMLFGSQKNPCMRVYSPNSLVNKCCSKPLADEVNEKIKIFVSRKDKNLEGSNPDCYPGVDNHHLNGHANDTKPQDSREIRGTVRKSPRCDQDDANDITNGLCLISEKHQLCEGHSSRQPCSDTIQTESLEAKACDMSHACKTPEPNNTSSNVSNAEDNSCTAKKDGNDNDVLDKVDDTNGESLQETLPNAEIVGKPVAHQGVNNRIDFVSQDNGEVLMHPLNESSCRISCCSGSKRMDSISKSKLGLNPSSRLKLFKIRDSFGYRRLLPYLTDIAKNNYGDYGNGCCPKLEKSLEESQSSQLPIPELYETPAKNLNHRSYDMEHDTDSCTLEMAILPTAKHVSGSNHLNLTCSKQNSDSPMSNGSREEQESKVVDMISDHQDGQSNDVPTIVRLVSGSSSVATPLCSSFVCPTSFSADDGNSVSHEISADAEEGCRKSAVKITNSAKPADTGCFSQSSSNVEVSDPLGIHAHDSRKGILKRVPRGCKGPCMCLKCASFRLHAERAFEFSKNQMQDAEEVALDLIKELSHLRNMLEKAAFGSNDNHAICINEVKRACKEASEAEELAKSRLSQMNYDLTVHCRLPCEQRPRVRFSNNVEERIISQLNCEQSSN